MADSVGPMVFDVALALVVAAVTLAPVAAVAFGVVFAVRKLRG